MSNHTPRIISFNSHSQKYPCCLERILPPQGCNFFPPRCEPNIQMTISNGVNGCTFNINGTVTCSGQPVSSGTVSLTASLTSGIGSVTVSPIFASVTNGTFSATLTATQVTIGIAEVMATTIVNGITVSTTATTSITCPSSCAFRTCTVDVSCGGTFPCPPPSGITITVGPGPGFNFSTIQAAVNAANNGDIILVFPGTYPEQITIPAGKDNLTIISQTPQAAIITPPPIGLIGNFSIVTVNARCTTISGFTITGPSTTQGNLRNGIFVTMGGSAVIENNLITNIRDNPLSGLQQGAGINVDMGSAQIINNIITSYQKTGIRVNGAESCSAVFNNTVTGVGATSVIAQNGIQISRGATAIVQNNTVTGNIFTGPGGVVSTGILLFQEVATAPVCVEFNNMSNNDAGLALASTTGTLVQGNNSSNNTQLGILVDSDSTNNVFIRNTALGNPTFDIEDDSVGQLSAMTGNFWLCNTCNKDNKGGAICSSVSEFPELPIDPPVLSNASVSVD